MPDDLNRRWIEGKDLDELLAGLMSPQVGSQVHEQVKAAIQVQIAMIQREAAADAVRWAKISAISTASATVIALVALVVALAN
jgi:hypothetical protein